MSVHSLVVTAACVMPAAFVSPLPLLLPFAVICVQVDAEDLLTYPEIYRDRNQFSVRTAARRHCVMFAGDSLLVVDVYGNCTRFVCVLSSLVHAFEHVHRRQVPLARLPR